MKTRITLSNTAVAIVLAGLVFTATQVCAAPASLTIAENHTAKVSVLVSDNASPTVRAAAQTLSEYLGKISGGKFEVTTGDGKRGLAVGRFTDFPAAPQPKPWDERDPTRQEDYLLRTHADGAWLLGASDLAVEHAVWDVLNRLGYRQFFPSEAWEVVPRSATLMLAVDRHEHPAYYARRIWYGYGAAAWSRTAYANWCSRNRATSGIEMRSGHAYDGILKRNKAEFDKHPEYLGLWENERSSTKFCISNPGLRQLVAEDALKQFAEDATLHSVSVDPSDGGRWCQCDACRKLGSVSDRAVTLANHVAETVEKKYPGKFVGMYAYNEHSPPPSIRVHPRVVINVATAFIKGGYSVDQLMAGWRDQGATVGIREYYSVHTWDRDLPGKARGSNPDYLKRTIPHFHSLGARFLSAESSDNWGCNGLGYYLAARMLWDVKEAECVAELKTDFFDRAFGPARPPLEKFYSLIDAANRPLLTDDLLGRLYRLLREGYALTDDPMIHARLRDLTLYVRYLELWTNYENATGDQRQAAFEQMARHAYRSRKSAMVHTIALVRDLPARDKTIITPKEAKYTSPEATNPWLSNEPFSPGEISQLIATGIDTRKLFDFEPIAFSVNLVPATKLQLRDMPAGAFGIYSRGVRNYSLWIDSAPAKIPLVLTGGLVYQNKGPAHVQLFPDDEPEGRSVAEALATPDKQPHAVELATTFRGLHRVELSDHGAGTRADFAAGTKVVVCSSPETPAALHGRWSLYFYVPKGTKVIGGFSDGPGTLLDPNARPVHKFTGKAEYFSIPVPAGADGKAWQFDRCAGRRLLMTVPPYLARSPGELLLPVEVVTADAP